MERQNVASNETGIITELHVDAWQLYDDGSLKDRLIVQRHEAPGIEGAATIIDHENGFFALVEPQDPADSWSAEVVAAGARQALLEAPEGEDVLSGLYRMTQAANYSAFGSAVTATFVRIYTDVDGRQRAVTASIGGTGVLRSGEEIAPEFDRGDYMDGTAEALDKVQFDITDIGPTDTITLVSRTNTSVLDVDIVSDDTLEETDKWYQNPYMQQILATPLIIGGFRNWNWGKKSTVSGATTEPTGGSTATSGGATSGSGDKRKAVLWGVGAGGVAAALLAGYFLFAPDDDSNNRNPSDAAGTSTSESAVPTTGSQSSGSENNGGNDGGGQDRDNRDNGGSAPPPAPDSERTFTVDGQHYNSYHRLIHSMEAHDWLQVPANAFFEADTAFVYNATVAEYGPDFVTYRDERSGPDVYVIDAGTNNYGLSYTGDTSWAVFPDKEVQPREFMDRLIIERAQLHDPNYRPPSNVDLGEEDEESE